MKIQELPKLERPNEKLLNYGAEKLSDAELLAIIIKTGTKNKTSIELVLELMKKFNYEKEGLSFLNDLSISEIKEITGIGEVKAIQLKAIVEISKRISRPPSILKTKITTPKDVAKVMMEDLRYLKQEHLLTILMDYQNKIVKIVTVTIGGLNSNSVEPRELFKEAVKSSAAKMILVHNHPSGNPLPSDSDVRLTKRCVEAGKIFGIDILDHIVIGDGVYSSLKELNKF